MVFERALSTAGSTVPAHSSVFLSQYRSAHGVSFTRSRYEGSVSLVEVLRGKGYQTAGFYSAPPLSPTFGFDRGFGIYEHADPGERQASAPEVVERALQWLEDRDSPDAPYFLFLHFFDVHGPRDRRHPERPRFAGEPPTRKGPPRTRRSLDRLREVAETYDLQLDFDEMSVRELHGAALRQARERNLGLEAIEQIRATRRFAREDEEIEWVRARYDQEIAYLDAHLEQLFERLEAGGYLERAIVVFVGDHGEMLYDRDNYFAGHTLYAHDSIARVPMLMKLPGAMTGTRVSDPVSLIDIAPTVLDYAGLKDAIQGQGVSLRHLVEEGKAERARPILVEASQERALLLDRYKLVEVIESGQRSLYDLSSDPEEADDLLARETAEAVRIADRLSALLERMVAANQQIQERGPAADAEVDSELRKSLEALGYVL